MTGDKEYICPICKQKVTDNNNYTSMGGDKWHAPCWIAHEQTDEFRRKWLAMISRFDDLKLAYDEMKHRMDGLEK